ncbi:hypothetical protein D3C72_1613170 [compost metagenome]
MSLQVSIPWTPSNGIIYSAVVVHCRHDGDWDLHSGYRNSIRPKRCFMRPPSLRNMVFRLISLVLSPDGSRAPIHVPLNGTKGVFRIQLL